MPLLVFSSHSSIIILVLAYLFGCLVIWGSFYNSTVDALQLLGPLLLGRRDVLLQGAGTAATTTTTALIIADNPSSGLQEIFLSDKKKKNNNNNKKQQQQQRDRVIEWSPPSEDYSQLRYSASSLLDKEAIVPTPNSNYRTLPVFPSWMEGNWLCTYTFDSTSFPQGRIDSKLFLKVPGTGLGTCAVLPNVGYTPKVSFVQRFGRATTTITTTSDSKQNNSKDPAVQVIEDVAYNLPRKFEAFWPQAKVTSVQVSTTDTTATSKSDRNASTSTTGTRSNLSPPCLVTGEGCTKVDNPLLHGKYATRCRMEFQGPNGFGVQPQSFDLSMVDYESTTRRNEDEDGDDDGDEFLISRTFVQYNIEQELTCYYREFVSFIIEKEKQEQINSTTTNTTTSTTVSKQRTIKGRTQVAAFLPSSPQAVAMYSYTMKYDYITNDEEKTLMN